MSENRQWRRLFQQNTQSNKSSSEKYQECKHLLQSLLDDCERRQAHNNQRMDELMATMIRQSRPTSNNIIQYLSAVKICYYALWVVVVCLVVIPHLARHLPEPMSGICLGIVISCMYMVLGLALYVLCTFSKKSHSHTHAKLCRESNSIINSPYAPKQELQKRPVLSEKSQNIAENEDKFCLLAPKEE